MNTNLIKEELTQHLGKTATIKYNLGRNKYEKYHVIIKELYGNIFLVELNGTNTKELKSFSYSDVITQTIKITF